MQITSKTIGIALVLVTAISVIVAIPLIGNLPTPSTTTTTTSTTTTTTTTTTVPIDNTINFTLLDNAGIMIEALGMRIYIDPYHLPENYSSLPADVICVTHGHFDHYSKSSIDIIRTSSTVTLLPEIYTRYIEENNGTGFKPGDQFLIGDINITAFYSYELPRTGFGFNHLRVNNYTSFIVDINGFTIFHPGDANNIPELENLTGQIDVVLLPMYLYSYYGIPTELVNITKVIQPRYAIPIHFAEGVNEDFVSEYGPIIETETSAEVICLDYYSSLTFEFDI